VLDRPALTIRPYASVDAEATLNILIDAVTTTAAADYTAEQIQAWTRPDDRPLEDWDQARLCRDTFVAAVEGQLVGFSDVSAAGYIDMMFVTSGHGRQGAGHALLTFLEKRAVAAGAGEMSADVSLTARRFFEAHGFIAEGEQHPVIAGVRLTNFHMTKTLRPVLRE
jgi:putative acetyltransferase